MKLRIERYRNNRLLGLSAVITVAFYLVLYFSTDRWRVFADDILPSFEWWALIVPHNLLMFAIWLIPVFTLTYAVAIFGKRAGHWRWLALLAFIPVFIVCKGMVIRSRLQNCTSSCANHSAFWGSHEFAGNVPLTNSIEFADFLQQMHGPEVLNASRYCPGWKRAGTKTGVVFVGGGLDLNATEGTNALVAFCSWKCHPPPIDHQHYLIWERAKEFGEGYSGYFARHCAKNTTAMIATIEEAINLADRGVLRYSPDARKLLQEELAQRKQLIGDKPDDVVGSGK